MKNFETAIIFGSSGQDGHYLNLLLKTNGINVIKISRKTGDYIGDIGDFTFVENLIKKIKPQYIFHFAANSTINHNAIFENHIAISTGTVNILEASRLHSIDSKIFLSGSALQFENNGVPINEDNNFSSLSAYSVSRIQSVYTARYFREKFKMKIYVGYLFNHDSPLRKKNHFNQKIISAVKEIIENKKTQIELGNLNSKKEFGFAGDVVEAIWLLVNQDKYFEVIIGTGVAYSLRDWVEKCFKRANLDWEKHVKHNEKDEIEYDILVSNPTLIMQMGWKPKFNIDDLVELMFQ